MASSDFRRIVGSDFGRNKRSTRDPAEPFNPTPMTFGDKHASAPTVDLARPGKGHSHDVPGHSQPMGKPLTVAGSYKAVETARGRTTPHSTTAKGGEVAGHTGNARNGDFSPGGSGSRDTTRARPGIKSTHDGAQTGRRSGY